MRQTIKKTEKEQSETFGFIRVAAVAPPLKVGDVHYNVSQIIAFAKKAIEEKGAQCVVFPELSITGYTVADLFDQRLLIEQALKGLLEIQEASKKMNGILLIGAPIESEGKRFNCAAVIANGVLYGLIPKTSIPGYKEFYEERWFASARDLRAKEVEIDGQKIPIGTDILFPLSGTKNAVLGVEICEDVWTPIPPSSIQAVHGATLIANLSASNDLVGKADYRRNLITQQSGRGICGYIYASCGVHESTTDVVFGGHLMIAENGGLLAESERFKREGEMIISEIDIDHLALDRMRTTSFGESIHEIPKKEFRSIEIPFEKKVFPTLERRIDPFPFVPSNVSERSKRCKEIVSIQSAGFAKRIEKTGIQKVLIGLSGGLDSTLAFLVAVKTMRLLGLPLKNINAITMPGFGTTARTEGNAGKLAKVFGVTFDTISITDQCTQHLKDIRYQGDWKKDVTFQNAQARIRTLVLMDKANEIGGMVMGTGDLSEIALGWCTFTGDHIAHYNVNASVPKTLVRYLVEWISEQDEFVDAKETLQDILNTPISPELVNDSGKKKSDSSQKTEDLIGPYGLHDFSLYYFARWGDTPSKIVYLAKQAFSGKRTESEIKKWLTVFIKRFFGNQWKRSVATDGPKVGSVSLSPRGDWRMPSDGEARLWLEDLEND